MHNPANGLRGYAKTISEATGVTDPATLVEIEDFMRDEHRTLDALSRPEFFRCARECWRTVARRRGNGASEPHGHGRRRMTLDRRPAVHTPWTDENAYRPDPIELLRRSGFRRTIRDDFADFVFAVRAQHRLALICTAAGFVAGMLGVIVPCLLIGLFL